MKVQFDRQKFMRQLTSNVRDAVKHGALDLQQNVKDRLSLKSSNIGQGGVASPPGDPPALNTGGLWRSIQMVEVTTSPLNPTFRVGTNHPYAKVQEFGSRYLPGGRIKPKKGKYLAVPLGVEGRRAAREANGDIRKLNLKLIVTKAHKLFLVREQKKLTRYLFQLVKFVILPPRPYLRPSFEATKPAIQKKIGDAVKATLAGVNK